MTTKKPESVKILLLAETAEKIRHWSEILQPISDNIWLDWAAIPADQQPEVIITDGTPVFEGDNGVIRIGGNSPGDCPDFRGHHPDTDGATWEGWSRWSAMVDENGTAPFCGPSPAYVNLPADASPRELQLACRLLAEIVRLRRKELAITLVQHRLFAEAFTDPLTGLANRRAWDQLLRERLDAVTDVRCLCLAIFDLDHFKQINDAYGHAAGDEVLKSVASGICESLRQGDFVARIGGDEFGLLIWVPNLDIAPDVVERVRSALPDRLTKSGIHRVTASAGLAGISATSPATNPSALFALADEALRRAKQEGRNRTVSSR
jgi:diguanylate cyclase (GGDEF)-like protein